MSAVGLGLLELEPAATSPELLAPSVASAVRSWRAPVPVESLYVAAIDAELADTAAFCAAYDVPLTESANCVVVLARRGEVSRYAACVVLATSRADINGLARRTLDARKISFAPMDDAIAESGMEFGGITPIGLPSDWPILIDAAVAEAPRVVIGSGLRRSKLIVPGSAIAALPHAQVLPGLGVPAPAWA